MTGTERMVPRTISPGSAESVPAHPDQVPAFLDAAALRTVLAAGRPDTVVAGCTSGTLTVRGMDCPTMSLVEGRGGPPPSRSVICVHGLGHDSFDWTPLFVRCKTEPLAVHAFDLPGFGLAHKPAGGRYTLDLYTEALLAFAAQVREQSGAPPTIVASSLGGHIALLAALQNPRAFGRLVLLAPGGLVEAPSTVAAMARAYYGVNAIVGRSESEIVNNTHRIFAHVAGAAEAGARASDDALAARKLAVHRSSEKRAFAVPFSGVVDDVFNHVVIGRVHEIKVPTMIVCGERDVVVPAAACADAARRMSARFVAMKDVGHCPHLEVPNALADLVLPFILTKGV